MNHPLRRPPQQMCGIGLPLPARLAERPFRACFCHDLIMKAPRATDVVKKQRLANAPSTVCLEKTKHPSGRLVRHVCVCVCVKSVRACVREITRVGLLSLALRG